MWIIISKFISRMKQVTQPASCPRLLAAMDRVCWLHKHEKIFIKLNEWKGICLPIMLTYNYFRMFYLYITTRITGSHTLMVWRYALREQQQFGKQLLSTPVYPTKRATAFSRPLSDLPWSVHSTGRYARLLYEKQGFGFCQRHSQGLICRRILAPASAFPWCSATNMAVVYRLQCFWHEVRWRRS